MYLLFSCINYYYIMIMLNSGSSLGQWRFKKDFNAPKFCRVGVLLLTFCIYLFIYLLIKIASTQELSSKRKSALENMKVEIMLLKSSSH